MFHLLIKEFLENVCKQIKYKPAKNVISQELTQHIEEIKEDYFVREEEEQEEHLFICTRKIGGYYEVEVSNSLLLSQNAFIELLKEKHKKNILFFIHFRLILSTIKTCNIL